MSIRSIVEEFRTGSYQSEDDDEPIPYEVGPGLSPQEIEEVRKQWCPDGYPLPKDLIEALGLCSTIDCPLEVDLRGVSHGQSAEYLLPNEIQIALDGYGNSWNIYPTPQQEELSHIFYVSHDPPVMVYQCHGIESFLSDMKRADCGDDDAQLNRMQNEVAMNVYGAFSQLPLAGSLTDSPDETLRKFARSVPENWSIADMRDLKFGAGFLCAPPFKGIPAPVKCEDEWIFAISTQPEPGAKKPSGFFGKLFGR